MRCYRWPSLLLALSLGSAALAQARSQSVPSPRELRSRLDAAAPALLHQHDVPSVAVAYIHNGALAWTAVYGNQSPGVPATADTLYEVASLTKPITAETILRLASQHKLSLDEPISPFWIDPDIKDNPWTSLLTPRICLAHETGFRNWRSMTGSVLTFKFRPGTAMSYSGEGYNYVAHFAEKKTGVSFDLLAKTYVFDPIGMHDTSYTPQPNSAARLAIAHTAAGDVPEPANSHWNAADLVHTTIGDYARFVVSVMHDQGVTPQIAAQRRTIHRDLVTPESRAKICSALPAGQPCSISVGMALGWQVMKLNDNTILEHTGSDTGFHSLAFLNPASGVGVVVLTNGDNGDKVADEIGAMLYPDPLFDATLRF
ncbi:MAG TPA: serine hydrolase domain-containing protein [Acidobacteriaceae bacterium]|nr:serine hydrolase domain-containing protein [Acidobacteriaceae bacterium]